MISEKEIINFIEKEFWKSNLNSDSDIFETLKITGDDCEDLLFKYKEKFDVDFDSFLWYFHFDEETSPFIGGLFFKSPCQRVKRIKITPKMLSEFANSKVWNIDYPEHKLPKYRFDILINGMVGVIAVAILTRILYHKYFT
ncbi:MAG: hypothetical protein CVU07_05180 [Bacteroidetes bacterium HGW-Bacteroidetes-23]|nr:MAG: hypothetical protein CVU07_05180 [Bacteroidetes bacterium HGW-Bacteroidetes-23]